jgi:hypothetical protein
MYSPLLLFFCLQDQGNTFLQTGIHRTMSQKTKLSAIFHIYRNTRKICSFVLVNVTFIQIERLRGLEVNGSKQTKHTLWLLVHKYVHRPSGRCLWAKLVSTFASRGVSCGQCNGFCGRYSWFSRPEPLLFIQVALRTPQM